MTAGKRERLSWPIIRTELRRQIGGVLAVADLLALMFVSADEGLLAAAVAEGLQVENPSRH